MKEIAIYECIDGTRFDDKSALSTPLGYINRIDEEYYNKQ